MADPSRINITICGDGGTGKSSITLRLVRSQWTHEYDPTIEDSYSLSRVIDGQTYFLNITDTAGQEEYRAMQSAYSRQADAFLLVYDVTNQPSLHEQLPYFLDVISMESEAREGSGKVPPVKVVAGNKCDLNGDRQISASEGLRWARENGCGFMETSARECVNVEETFALIVRRVVEARRLHAAPPPPPPVLANGKSKDKKHAHGDSFARTRPLSPEGENEKGGGIKKVWWKRFLCGLV